MINIPAIQSCFQNLVGFRQNKSANGVELSDALLTSESGIFIQEIHSLLSIDNLLVCVQEEKDNFSDFLIAKRNAAISSLINKVYTLKHLNENSKELVTEVRLYDGTGNFKDKVAKLNRFVGFRIGMKESDISMIIRMIGLQFDTAQEKLPIYIYHTSKKEQVAKLELDYATPNSFAWKNLTTKLTLPFVKGGGYVIGYYESDIEGQAINRPQYFYNMPACADCNMLNYNYYRKWFRYLAIQPFYVDVDNLNEDKTKWDSINEVYTDGWNYGLNLCIGLQCDMSDLFCRNREIFAHALSLQLADLLLEEMSFSTRFQPKITNMAIYARGNKELNGPEGIQVQLEKAIKALDFNTSDISKVCMPCNSDGQSMRIKSVY